MGTVRTRRDPPPRVPIPTAEYICRIKGVKPDAYDTQFGKKDLVIFEIVDGPWKGHEATKGFGQSLGPKAKMTSLITSVGLPPVADGQGFELESLIGKQIVVGIKASSDNEGAVYNNAETWRPYFPGTIPPPVVSPQPAAAPAYIPPAPATPAMSAQPAAYPPGYVPNPAPPPQAVPPAQPAPQPVYTPPPASSTSGRPNF